MLTSYCIILNNGFIIQAAPIKDTNLSRNFPISFSRKVCGIAFSQSGASSSSVVRLAFASYSLTGFSVTHNNTSVIKSGAFYIACGF